MDKFSHRLASLITSFSLFMATLNTGPISPDILNSGQTEWNIHSTFYAGWTTIIEHYRLLSSITGKWAVISQVFFTSLWELSPRFLIKNKPCFVRLSEKTRLLTIKAFSIGETKLNRSLLIEVRQKYCK